MRTISFGPLKSLSLKRHKMSIKIISGSRSLSCSLSLTVSFSISLALCEHLNCAKLSKNSFAHAAFVCRLVRIERLSCTFFLLAMLYDREREDGGREGKGDSLQFTPALDEGNQLQLS